MDNIYTYRLRNLQELGFSSYEEYLKSDLWKTNVALRIKKKKCAACGRNWAYTLHHRCYSLNTLRFTGKGLDRELIPICKECHYVIEFKEDGTKRINSTELRTILRQLRMTNNCLPPHICTYCGKQCCIKKDRHKDIRVCGVCKRRLKNKPSILTPPSIKKKRYKQRVWAMDKSKLEKLKVVQEHNKVVKLEASKTIRNQGGASPLRNFLSKKNFS